ncbi:redox-regulated ATPase YchF [Candidatus Woesebacteria bacterium RIFCSPHIGHO2_02_FULL_38_9]|uniref:Ribosome-binding ATPase YchF n=1 Tax=Candidatus Woesebacteria bacterium RIFCSPHIGHO2_01_FULL_39_28 TaxID=1802496 RepID=A0A1F7YGU1_9BACT|nr:MAG: redox-regulated ATPase YchF [Candidatus Woesebacteria bacterium RIFCSPHIGHO2_01_FULL_39_28]OGM32267.1 MAG: redox-regulated ATPase YchF [Candidatus Woesebacteria bacterium RIFCSPHIGHO2_02_FULL_38_9]OGM56868.1 MAG: redox-regulated ATPase YchF [Candidatus Woesebacteria bacterium RIFCSPLOWO2_01_FULL_38_20]
MSSSKLAVGIVGLPNVGKSTLFNALLKRQQAYVANFPFATIEPNIGVVPVPDPRLKKLSEVVKESENIDHLPPEIPATCEFVDIAGLIAGAHKGEGLGNKFLSHIREVDAICHVIRAFSDPEIIKEGSSDPKTDLEIIETELKLADLQTLEKQKDPGNTPDKEQQKRWSVILKLKEAVSQGKPARDIKLSEEEHKISKQLSLLTSKPILIVLNVDESQLKESGKTELKFADEVGVHSSQARLDARQVIAICAKIESELSSLSESDQRAYLDDLGVKESGLERLIKHAFETLGLITFLTAGEKEVRAWTVRLGCTALTASGTIHTDFMKNFIKADVVSLEDFIEFKGWKACRELGKVRSEGKDYILHDGDIVEFRVSV